MGMTIKISPDVPSGDVSLDADTGILHVKFPKALMELTGEEVERRILAVPLANLRKGWTSQTTKENTTNG